MNAQLLFLDTEFTCFQDPQLISLGLVATSGEEFYAEVPYAVDACSEFVRDVVLPLLGSYPHAACPIDELRNRLLNWLSIVKAADEIHICFDSAYDEKLFLHALDLRIPSFVNLRMIGTRHVNELLRYRFHVANDLPEHHALNDARALCYAFREPWSKDHQI